MIPWAASFCRRSRSRAARSADRHDCWRCCSAVWSSRRERVVRASGTLGSRRSRTSPFLNASPSRNGMDTTRPPVSGEIWARRRAFTVPARELVTVCSTRPRETSVTVTSIGLGAKTVARRASPTATIPRRISRRIVQRRIVGLNVSAGGRVGSTLWGGGVPPLPREGEGEEQAGRGRDALGSRGAEPGAHAAARKRRPSLRGSRSPFWGDPSSILGEAPSFLGNPPSFLELWSSLLGDHTYP